MYPLQSRLTDREQEFMPASSALSQIGFALGGSWDYDHGSFDCALDGENKVWLRLPFQVTNGNLDSETTEENDARIRFGEPYVLKHLYNEGLDPEAGVPSAMGAAFNQFQDPVDPDADIEPRWIDIAREKLEEAERIEPI